MPKRHINSRARRCPSTKVIYRDNVAATLALEKVMLHARREIHFVNRTYDCELCGGWHLTAAPKRNTAQRIAHSA